MSAELLTANDLLKLLQIGRTTLYRHRSEPSFPRPVQALGSRLKWRRTDVMRWLERRPAAKSTKRPLGAEVPTDQMTIV